MKSQGRAYKGMDALLTARRTPGDSAASMRTLGSEFSGTPGGDGWIFEIPASETENLSIDPTWPYHRSPFWIVGTDGDGDAHVRETGNFLIWRAPGEPLEKTQAQLLLETSLETYKGMASSAVIETKVDRDGVRVERRETLAQLLGRLSAQVKLERARYAQRARMAS